ncbi:MAG: polysaccharide biosynthesis/export family protein [Nitrospirae bacterium]|nr:polysaccharide biosynthesis/export family protein [Nitrospirota bacterium]
MSQKILILMMAGMLWIFLPLLSLAADVETTPPASTSDDESDEEAYVIGLGDVIDISAWKDEALTRSCVVRPDGAISFPLIGEVRAAGKTSSQLKAEIKKKLDRFVPDVILSVDIKQVNSMIVYVIGKVNAPGRIVTNADVDVLQALATVGGLNIYAKRNSIKIFRDEKNETTIFPFQYDEIVEGRRLEQNIKLKRGDVVVVP